MESRMSEVGRTAIRIGAYRSAAHHEEMLNYYCFTGEQLESVHQERLRAQAAYDIIDYYNQFTRDDTSKLDALLKEGREGRRKVAVLLRRLTTVAKEVDLPNAEKVK